MYNYLCGRYKNKPVQVACFYDDAGNLIGQKLRFPDKTFITLGQVSNTFFGQQKFSGGRQKIIITEGEIDRFVERCDRPAEDILPLLHNAVLACVHRARRAGVKRVIRVAEERGGYVLFCETCYFVIVPDARTGSHVVTTVMTPRYMGRGYPLAS
jgi:hypothetical protein